MKTTVACISPYMGHEGHGAAMDRPYGSFYLRSCRPGEAYTTVSFEDHTDNYPLHVDLLTPAHNLETRIPAVEIAKDFIQSTNLANEGGFICSQGSTPTEQELAEAHDRREKWLIDSVNFGNKIFGRLGARGIEQIPDYCKRAAVELDVVDECEWVFKSARSRVECAGCGTAVALLKDGSSPAICLACRAPLDIERAIRLGLYTPPKYNATGDGLIATVEQLNEPEPVAVGAKSKGRKD